MAFSYHKPTRCSCKVCEQLLVQNNATPMIDTWDGRASSANGYPFHDWYHFVLGYTPSFPEYMLKRCRIIDKKEAVVLDPFVGSGTTQLVCKLHEIPSVGIDANDFMVFAAKQKLNWYVDVEAFADLAAKVREKYDAMIAEIHWDETDAIAAELNSKRPPSLDQRYISDKPLMKLYVLKDAVNSVTMSDSFHDLFMFAISAILVPVSNVKYGPGFGVGKPKDDADVIGSFEKKVRQMISDLKQVSDHQRETKAETILGDSRHLSDYLPADSIDMIITSPPYPGDHEYTKHSKLELIFNGFATDLSSFRTIKKRMIRGSTTNIYKEDNDRSAVADIAEIKAVTDEIAARLDHDGATSGFEKLYTKLVWEYFGGMAYTLSECKKVLKHGGRIALLVSDSHAFKMVHVQTAELLKKVGEQVGFVNAEVILWQMKNSTSHKYQLRENILILEKP